MYKRLSSEAIIGNFILSSVEKDKINISIEEIMCYDEELSLKLKEYNYLSRFDFDEIIKFKYNYPFFIEDIFDDHIKVFYDNRNKNEFINELIRYFRFGMPTIVVNEMISVSQSVLDQE